MSSLTHQLGINAKLLLSQGVNFFILLAALTILVYRPLVKILNERRAKIESGLARARKAEKRLAEIEELKREKIREGEEQAFNIVKTAEVQASARGDKIVREAEDQAENLLEKAKEIEDGRRIEALERLSEESKNLIREALAKIVRTRPGAVDETLIEEAAAMIKREKA